MIHSKGDNLKRKINYDVELLKADTEMLFLYIQGICERLEKLETKDMSEQELEAYYEAIEAAEEAEKERLNEEIIEGSTW